MKQIQRIGDFSEKYESSVIDPFRNILGKKKTKNTHSKKKWYERKTKW
jgi:delta-aminolevulinic acid dehydratase/porphobilinogen synthase